MAILKIVHNPIHPGLGSGGTYKHLKEAIDYILNLEKTGHGWYTGGHNCMSMTALQEMIDTKKQYGKEPKHEKDRLAYHFIISWSPKEAVSPDMALDITREFCESCLTEYEAVYAAHLDTQHMHTHILFNSVNFKTGRKYRYEKNDWEKILQPLLNRLCKERGLHALEDDTGKTLKEHGKERDEKKWSREKGDRYYFADYIRDDIDELIFKSGSFEEFEQGLRQRGYKIKYGTSERYGEYMALRNPEMKKFRRIHTLGAEYTMEMIKSRIAAYHEPLPDGQMNRKEPYLMIRCIYHCRICYGTDNAYLRKQYARMYRLGILPKQGKRLSYKETLQRLEELHRLEYQINLIAERDYKSAEDLDADIEVSGNEIENLKQEARKVRTEKRPFVHMLSDYEKLEALEGADLLWQEGEEIFGEEAGQYAELAEKVKHFPHSKEDLEAYLKQQEIRERQTKGKLRETEKRLRNLMELKTEYEQVIKEYEPAGDKLLEEMEEQCRKAESRKNQGKGKGR